MAVVRDVHVRRLFRLLAQGQSLSRSARLAGIDRKTARRYRNMQRLPSERPDPPRGWRTREDPFAEVWSEVAEQLTREPGLQAKTLWDWLRQKHPGRFADGQVRTFQRRVQEWRATQGPGQEVFFSQVHPPGRLCASDFTHMGSLNVTLGGQPFDHLMYHFVLTYSNWETVTICFSESFESLSVGLQNALGELGGVPERHRSDRMSSAVNNLSERRDFTERYEALLAHYGLTGEKIQARQAHENGDAESSHRHFKDAVAQALLLRGSRDFLDREAYSAFLREVCRQRNAGRAARLAEEQALLRPLPSRRLEACKRLSVTVTRGSTIHVQNNTYSVNSRLIGARVEVRIYLEHLEVWYGQKLVETLPRLRGRQKQRIDYRHVIDTLVRKPGALAHYRYREELFPTSRFRTAYDLLHEAQPTRADREYLAILYLAAHESESDVDQALRLLIESEQALSLAAVQALLGAGSSAPAPTAVTVPPADLGAFDTLFMEKWHEPEQRREGKPADVPERAPLARDAGGLRGASAAGGEGDAVVRAVSVGAEPAGMRQPAGAPHRASAAAIAAAGGEGSAELRPETLAGEGGAPSPDALGGFVPGPAGECFGLRSFGFGEDAFARRHGPRADSRRPQDVLRHVQLVGAGVVDRQARFEAEQSVETAGGLRWIDYRRHWLRAAEPRRDGSVVHAVGGALRTRQRATDQQPAVLEMGDDFQGPDDDSRRHRQAGASQRDLGIEPAELPTRTREEGDRFDNGHNRRDLPWRRAAGTGRPREPWGFLIVAHGEE
jgi:hypothetical protein